MAYAPSGAYDRPTLIMSYIVSGNNLSADSDIFIFVKPGATENTVVVAADGDVPMGVSYGTAKTGDSLPVAHGGIVKMRLAGSVKRGNMLKPYSVFDGRAVLSNNSAPYGGMALRDGASGNIIPMLVTIGIAS